MLEELHIKNLALIKETIIQFDNNYCSLVGETGAGKSLIVDALSFLKGNKFDISLKNNQDEKTVISASFKIEKNFLLTQPILNEYIEDSYLICKRVINIDNTSKYYINDNNVAISTYKNILNLLIDIHSQGENNLLLDEKNHLLILDQFSFKNISKIKDEYINAFNEYIKAKEDLSEFIKQNEELDEEYLTFQLKEINKYNLKDNEIEELLEEEKNLKSFDKINNSFFSYLKIKNNSDLSLDDILSKEYITLNEFKDTSLQHEALKIKENINDLLDSIDEFENKFNNLNFNPKRIDYVNQRLFDLKGLMRKYGNSTTSILNKKKEIEEKLNLIKDFDAQKKYLEEIINNKFSYVLSIGEKLSEIRKKEAIKLEQEVSIIMVSLGLKEDGFKVDLKKVEPKNSGIDDVKFLVCLNTGSPFNDLVKTSSGGENSRLMLALKVVLNKLNPYQLIVLDEIDTGVSGKIAFLVAKNIKNLSSSSQVLVISHLPQVIASSSICYEVNKKIIDNETISSIRKLNTEEKIEAIAKLLSSNKVTSDALKQAKNLNDEFIK